VKNARTFWDIDLRSLVGEVKAAVNRRTPNADARFGLHMTSRSVWSAVSLAPLFCFLALASNSRQRLYSVQISGLPQKHRNCETNPIFVTTFYQ
jgi:hypothetical protein